MTPPGPDGPVGPGEGARTRRRLRLPRQVPLLGGAGEEENIAHRLAHQWAQMRDERERRPAPAPAVSVPAGQSNFNRAQVPWGVDLAAAWGWRLLVIVAAGYVLARAVAYLSLIALPLAVALLVAALVAPVVHGLGRLGLPRGLASLLVVLGVLGMVGVMLTFAGQQVAAGASGLADQTAQGLEEVRRWLRDGPLNASESQINDYIEQAQSGLESYASGGDAVGQVTSVGTALTHVFAGFFIALFATYFFLADGDRIWAWVVRLAPRAARGRVDGSGRVAWVSLTQFVRATVVVAFVDAVGIAVVAAVLDVPFVFAIGVLVFLGSFVPMIGATVAGAVAVLVALVDQGPVTALLMFAGVIVVQQVEGQVLQPFLMGRWVSVHPLGVILAIGAGVIVGGVAGALVAVPLAAAVNAVVLHLAGESDPGDDPVEELAEDYQEERQRPEQVRPPGDPGLGDHPDSPAVEAATDTEEQR